MGVDIRFVTDQFYGFLLPYNYMEKYDTGDSDNLSCEITQLLEKQDYSCFEWEYTEQLGDAVYPFYKLLGEVDIIKFIKDGLYPLAIYESRMDSPNYYAISHKGLVFNRIDLDENSSGGFKFLPKLDASTFFSEESISTNLKHWRDILKEKLNLKELKIDLYQFSYIEYS